MRTRLNVLIHRCLHPGFAVDLRHALRTVRRNPGYALSAMFCLALAMGVNTTLFSFLDSMYFRKLPVPEPDRVVQIHREGIPTCTWSEYLDLRGPLRSLHAAAWFRFGAYADIGGVNQLLSIETTSANYAEVCVWAQRSADGSRRTMTRRPVSRPW